MDRHGGVLEDGVDGTALGGDGDGASGQDRAPVLGARIIKFDQTLFESKGQ